MPSEPFREGVVTYDFGSYRLPDDYPAKRARRIDGTGARFFANANEADWAFMRAVAAIQQDCWRKGLQQPEVPLTWAQFMEMEAA